MDRIGIAARVRELLALQDPDDIADLARRLNLNELSLRMTIDDLSLRPTMEVLSAIVAHCDADPAWILTGVSDPARHRRALEGTRGTITETVRELSSTRDTPSISRPAIRPRYTLPVGSEKADPSSRSLPRAKSRGSSG